MITNILKMPSRTEIKTKLRNLSEGALSPYNASQRAAQWEESTQRRERVNDFVVWIGLNDLYDADAFESEDEPMYDLTDFRLWLKKFEDACELNPLPNENAIIKKNGSIKLVNQNALKVRFPTRYKVKEKLKLLLLQNPYYLAEISQWAGKFIMELDENNLDIEDKALSKALRRLYWANMPSISEPQKFNLNDY